MFNYPRGKKEKPALNGDSIKRARGRPIGSGLSREPTIKAIRITELVDVMLTDWMKEYHAETYDAAIRAYVRDHGRLRKKVEALEQELQYDSTTPRLINHD
jgi:hypothetical protein